MKQHVLFIFSSFLLFSCNNKTENAEEIKGKQDSIASVQNTAKIQEEKKKNPFLIAPPDSTYSGDYLDKYANGNTKFKGFYRFGKRHGQWMAFYAEGKMWSECFYLQGMRHGANNTYYENGNPHYKGWYKNDLRDSTWTFYDEQGKEVNKVRFKDDLEVNTSDSFNR